MREAAAMYEVVPAETEDEPSQEAAVNQTEDEHLQRKASLEVRTDGSDKKRKMHRKPMWILKRETKP